MAVRICLASSPPLHSFLGNYDNHCSSSAAALLQRCEPLRPCLSSHVTTATTALPSAAKEISSSSSARLRRKKKKSVVFADSQGLALTVIHIFDEAEDNLLTELQFYLTEIEDATATLHLGGSKDPADYGSNLVLDFNQPAVDYLDLRNRLKAQQVCLETCSVQERLLSGTVQVRNICFEKSVSVRITFDSWCSFQDVQCRYLNNVYGCPDTDTFSFSFSVPQLLKPSNGVEFCIQYQTEDRTFWDNNNGNNYRLVVADPNGSPNRSTESTAALEIKREGIGEKREEMEFDPFGSPRTSAGIFPEWQSWGCVETGAPYCHGPDHWKQQCPAQDPESHRCHGEKPWCRWYLHPSVRLGWSGVEEPSPLLQPVPTRKSSTRCTSFTVVGVTRGMSQAATSLQQWRRASTTSTCV